MDEIKRMVIGLLKSYNTMKTRLEQLRYERSRLSSLSEQEMIRILSLGSAEFGNKVQNGHISDKTMAIALTYRNASAQLEKDAVNEIWRDARAIELELERLEQYVSALQEQKASIIRQYYFERKSWDELDLQFGMHKRTLQRLRDSAVDELASMYSYIAELEKKGEGQ